MGNPKVSVVVPVYNEEKYIGKLLSSLTEQTFKDFEVVLGDKSADNTRKVVEGYKDRLDVRIEEPPVLGISRQKNYAASKAKGEILLFIDADTVVTPNAVEKVVEILERKDFGTGRAQPDSDRWYDHLGLYAFHLYALLRAVFTPVASGAFIYVKKRLFEEVGGFNENMTFQEDFDLMDRLHKAGYRYGYIMEGLYRFSVRRIDQMGRPRFAMQMIWDGIVSLLPRSIRMKLTIGYPTTGHSYDD